MEIKTPGGGDGMCLGGAAGETLLDKEGERKHDEKERA